MSRGYQREFEDAIQTFSTPFRTVKTAEQGIQFSIDPQKGLTRRRYLWYSNDDLFGSSLFSEVESSIRLETNASTDEARIHSSFSGQYVSHSLTQPGCGLVVDDDNVEIDDNGRASLTHGEIYVGGFWWDEINDTVDTGIYYKFDSDGWTFNIKSLGQHIGDSPILQSEFNKDSFDKDSDSSLVVNPANGYIYNFPYTWYNQGPIGAGLVNPKTDQLELAHKEVINGRPSTNTSNFPVQLVVRNDGTAQKLGAELGGLQYSTYGATEKDIEFRETDETRITEGENFIADSKAITENAVDPATEPGVPLVSFRRFDESARDVRLRVQQFDARPISDDIYIYQWDEWNPDTALTGATFNDPVTPNNTGDETKVVTDTQATDYTPSDDSVLRSVRFVEGGEKNKTGARSSQAVDANVQIGATRVISAVNDGDSTADVDPFLIKIEESY